MAAFHLDKHVEYIKSLDKKEDFESIVMEHLRMSGAYWGLTALDLMHSLGDMNGEEIAAWILKCQHDCGGFGGNLGHDPHILYTLNAVQILALFNKLNVLDVDKVTNYISGLQKDDGSFAGDEWGKLTPGMLYTQIPRKQRTSSFDAGTLMEDLDVSLDQNLMPARYFCCVAALAILGALHEVDRDLLGWWLCERQVKSNGGLNGRPEKLPDVCYSWWVLSSLVILDRAHWINKEKLRDFILNCQDEERGGISDAPNDAVDVFHTYFGVAGLSLLEYPGVKTIDPAYALPVDVVDRIFYGEGSSHGERTSANPLE